MKQLRLRLLFVAFLEGLWLSPKVAHCQNTTKGTYKISYCYNTSSGKSCFTTFLANSSSNAARKNFATASDWCKTNVPGSSLIIINSIEDQRTVESFIGRLALANETIVTDGQKLLGRKRNEWSWVNGHHSIPKEVSSTSKVFHDGAYVDCELGKPLAYAAGDIRRTYHYICEYSDSRRIYSYQENNRYYVASNSNATWYDARNECLRLGGDLASLTDLRGINGSSWLRENLRYWIGLHRNRWIWNSTGASLTYTNWEGGYPNDSSDEQCICISPECSINYNTDICKTVDGRKWWTCNCNNSYAFVCQTEEKLKATTREIVNPAKKLSPTSEDSNSAASIPVHGPTKTHRSANNPTTAPTTASTTSTTTSTRSAFPKTKTSKITTTSTPIPIPTTTTTTTTTKTTKTTKITTTTTPYPIPTTTTTTTTTIPKTHKKKTSTAFTTSKSPINLSDVETTRFTQEMPSSKGLFASFEMKEIILIVVLFVTVVFIIVAVIVVLRKLNTLEETKNRP